MKNNPYIGNYIFAGSDFYVHLHKRNIGKANGGLAHSDLDLAQIFSNQKEENASAAVKRYYEQLFIKNLHMSSESFDLLNDVFEEDPEAIINQIDQQVKANLDRFINKEDLVHLMSIERAATTIAKDLISPDATKALNSFNRLLELLSEASRLINSDAGGDLAIALYELSKSSTTTAANMGTKLQEALVNFIKNANFSPINDAKIDKVCLAINALAKGLETRTVSTNKPLTEQNIVSVVDHLFNPGFAEVIASQLSTTLDSEIAKAIPTRLMGTETYDIQLTDVHGNILYGETAGGKRAGKTDFDFNLENIFVKYKTLNIDNIEMKIGISNKFYRSNYFPGLDTDMSKAFSFGGGSGGTLKEAIDAVFNDPRGKYLVYNALIWGDKMPTARAALNDLLLTRQINRIFATRGGIEDFSQFMLVNGEIVSIWEIIQYAVNNTMGKSNSQLTNSDSQAVSLSIENRAQMYGTQKIRNARIRVPRANNIINSSVITAHVHVDKLQQALSS